MIFRHSRDYRYRNSKKKGDVSFMEECGLYYKVLFNLLDSIIYFDTDSSDVSSLLSSSSHTITSFYFDKIPPPLAARFSHARLPHILGLRPVLLLRRIAVDFS